MDLPICWLVTDERQGDALLSSIEALPSGSAIIFRHYQTGATERRRLFKDVKQLADLHGHWLILSDTVLAAKRWHADGVHLTGCTKDRLNAARYAKQSGLLVTMTAHNDDEMARAHRMADIILVAPVYSTASHPGENVLGEDGFTTLARKTTRPVIALGGMTAQRFMRLADRGADGWAAIDGLTKR